MGNFSKFRHRTRREPEGYILRYTVATFCSWRNPTNFRPRIQVPRHLPLPLPPLEPHLESAAVAAFSRSPRPSFLSRRNSASNHRGGGAIRMLPVARTNREWPPWNVILFRSVMNTQLLNSFHFFFSTEIN